MHSHFITFTAFIAIDYHYTSLHGLL